MPMRFGRSTRPRSSLPKRSDLTVLRGMVFVNVPFLTLPISTVTVGDDEEGSFLSFSSSSLPPSGGVLRSGVLSLFRELAPGATSGPVRSPASCAWERPMEASSKVPVRNVMSLILGYIYENDCSSVLQLFSLLFSFL